MLPEWIQHQLEAMGIAGAIIFVLFSALAASIAYIRQLQAKADKIYGYRLQERDTLNKTMSDSSTILKDTLRVTEERNDLTEEHARLLQTQANAFELLKITVLAQYENIKDHNAASALAVTAMADSIRTLTAMIQENRTIALEHVNSVRKSIDEMSLHFREAITAASRSQITETRNLLGQVTTVQRRPRK